MLVTPDTELLQPIPVVGDPSELDPRDDDVVLLTMKTQHSWDAMLALRDVYGATVPVICCQNGVENERMASRLFQNVYGMIVMSPANHFEPGIVESNSNAMSGVLDAGCYPKGVDELISLVTAIIDDSNFSAVADDDIMRWKYKKLLMNLNNSLQAITEMGVATTEIANRVQEEALAVYHAAGIVPPSANEFRERQGSLVVMKPIKGQRRTGGSSWQSLKNGKGDIETDYLNGEIASLGRQFGVATPVNTALQVLASKAARQGLAPGSLELVEIEALILKLGG